MDEGPFSPTLSSVYLLHGSLEIVYRLGEWGYCTTLIFLSHLCLLLALVFVDSCLLVTKGVCVCLCYRISEWFIYSSPYACMCIYMEWDNWSTQNGRKQSASSDKQQLEQLPPEAFTKSWVYCTQGALWGTPRLVLSAKCALSQDFFFQMLIWGSEVGRY